MKKLSVNIAAILIVMMFHVNADAREYASLINEDYIWQYDGQSVYGVDYSPANIKFSGISVKGDVTYHNCYAYLPDEPFNVESATLIAYVREDSGKVYMLFNGVDGSPVDRWHNTYKYMSDPREIMIYDFNLNEGERLLGDVNNFISEETLADGDSVSSEILVTGVLDVELAGMERKMQQVKLTLSYEDLYTNTLDLHVLEGIGCLEYGFMPFPYQYCSALGYNPVATLSRVVDLDGNEIYSKNMTSVESVSANALCVSGGNGEILVGGDYPDLAVYDTTGRRYAGTRVPAGLYMVTAGGRTVKVLVK